jgi:cardiolipin synthase
LSALRHLPNAICLARIALTLPVVAALGRGDYWLALVVFSVAALSDGLDGYLAKRFNWTSDLGRILDPLADKILLVAAFLACAWAGLVPTWLAAAAIARDVMLVGGAVIFRFWFGPLPGHPSIVSKVNTGLQIAVVIIAILNAAVAVVPAVLVLVLAVVALATTLVSGIGYVGRYLRQAWSMPMPD